MSAEEEEEEEEEEALAAGERATVELPAVVPFSSADEESLSGRVAPSAPSHTAPVPARVRSHDSHMIVT